MSNNGKELKPERKTPKLDGVDTCVATNCPSFTEERDFIDLVVKFLHQQCIEKGFRLYFILIDNDKYGIRKPFTVKF